MKNPFQKTGVPAIEAELVNLKTRHATLETRRSDADAKLQAAKTARRNVLSGDPSADLGNLNRDVREVEDEIETLDGVLFDLREQMAEAETRLDGAKDAKVRVAAAKTLEGIAVSFDNAAADLERGLAIVGKAYAAMVAAVPESLQVIELDERVILPERASSISPDGVFPTETFRTTALPNDLARTVLAEGIARVCPMAFGYSRRNGDFHFELGRAGKLGSERPSFGITDLDAMGHAHSATEAASLLVSNRIRDRAKHVIAGDMSPDLEDQPIFRPVPRPQSVPLVEVFALENFAFQLEPGRAFDLKGKWWVHQVPEDAADAAVAAGVALRTDTEEGAREFQAAKDRRARSPHGMGGNSFLERSMCRDLGLVRKPPERIEDADLRDVA